jgi:hypothetical protein
MTTRIAVSLAETLQRADVGPYIVVFTHSFSVKTLMHAPPALYQFPR